jgi:hypothetical protein
MTKNGDGDVLQKPKASGGDAQSGASDGGGKVDPKVADEYGKKLLKILTGQVISDKKRKDMVDKLRAANAALASDPATLDISALRVGPELTGFMPEDRKDRGFGSKLKRTLSGKAFADKKQVKALSRNIADFRNVIAEKLVLYGGPKDTPSAYAKAVPGLRAFLDLADRLIAAGRYGEALEMLNSAQQMETMAMALSTGAKPVDDDAKRSVDSLTDQIAKKAIKPEAEGDPISDELADLRRAAVEARALFDRYDKWIGTNRDKLVPGKVKRAGELIDKTRAQLDAFGSRLDEVDAAKLPDTNSDAYHERLHEVRGFRVDLDSAKNKKCIQARLDELGGIVAGGFASEASEAYDVLTASFTETDKKGRPIRDGSAWTGAGKIRTKHGAPGPRVERALSKLAAIKAMGEAGMFGDLETEMAEELLEEARQELEFLERNSELYGQINDKLDYIKSKFDRDYWAYDSATLTEIKKKHEEYEAERDSTDELSGDAKKPGLLQKIEWFESSVFEPGRVNAREFAKKYEEFEKAAAKIESNDLSDYAKKLKKLVEAAEAAEVSALDVERASDHTQKVGKDNPGMKISPQLSLARRIKKAFKGREYKGRFWNDLERIRGRADKGDPEKVKAGMKALDDLRTSIAREIEEFDNVRKQLKSKENPKGNLVIWATEKARDFELSEREKGRKEAYKQMFETLVKRELKFCSNNAATATIEREDIFKAFGTRVEALESRAKGAVTASDYIDLINELKELHNQRVATLKNDRAAETGKPEDILARHEVHKARFLGQLDSFFDNVLKKQADQLETDFKDSERDEAANTVIEVAKKHRKEVEAFFDEFRTALKKVDLDLTYKDKIASSDRSVQLAAREAVLSELRMQRAVLEKSPPGVQLQACPYFLGPAISVMQIAIQAAEIQLLKSIKPKI